MKANDFVVLALRSPLHVLMGETMLITLTGRKTGRKITVPVNYAQEGDELWVLSSRNRTWWRNLRKGGEVDVRLHGQEFKGLGEVVLDEAAVAAQLGRYVKRLPTTARHMGIRVDNGEPNCDDLGRIAKERLFVKICLRT